VAAIALPLMVFSAGAHLAFQTTISAAKADLLSDVAVAKEQVTRVLDTHRLIAGEVNELVGRLDDEAIAAQEAALRARIMAIIAPFPQVSGVAVIGTNGQPLVTTLAYPVDHSLRFDDRDYFQTLRDKPDHLAIGEIVWGRLSHRRNFSIAVRKGFDPDRFNGLVLVTVPPEYFERFDAALFDKSPAYSAGVFRDDGVNLARYPALDPASPPPRFGDSLLQGIRDNPAAGLVRGVSSPDPAERLIAYRKLDEYPVYITVGRTWASIVGEWRGLMATHLIFGVPATLALFGLSLLAIRHERRQTHTVAALRAEADRRALAEEALRQSQKMEAIGRLTGGIAHDFNNNLTVISSSVELLKRRLPPGTEALHKLTDAAMQGVGRAATLTQRLLAFARQQPLDPEPLDAGRLVADMSDLLHRSLGESIALETVLAGGLWLTRVDANQLENAIINLAVNARDAMPDGGKLTIETANTHLDEGYAAAHADVQPGQYVMLAITDTGTGMAPEVIAQAFEPFFTTKPVGQGTGLGLSMVYGFVKQSGGHVKIYSEPGKARR
jgi:signal transduction histidine kinase